MWRQVDPVLAEIVTTAAELSAASIIDAAAAGRHATVPATDAPPIVRTRELATALRPLLTTDLGPAVPAGPPGDLLDLAGRHLEELGGRLRRVAGSVGER